jgi:hypothetical protein
VRARAPQGGTPHWMARLELPNEPSPPSWLLHVNRLTSGEVGSFNQWIRALKWTPEEGVRALSLANLHRLQGDPKGRFLGLTRRANALAAWPRLQALLIAGPLRGGALGGVYQGRALDFEASFDPRTCDISTQAPFGDHAWARIALRRAGEIEWNAAAGAALGATIDLCAKAQQFSSMISNFHNPCLPDADALAWFLAACPTAARAYFKARPKSKARWPRPSVAGLTWLARAALDAGADVQATCFVDTIHDDPQFKRVDFDDLARLATTIPARGDTVRSTRWALACAAATPSQAPKVAKALLRLHTTQRDKVGDMGGALLWDALKTAAEQPSMDCREELAWFLGKSMQSLKRPSEEPDWLQACRQTLRSADGSINSDALRSFARGACLAFDSQTKMAWLDADEMDRDWSLCFERLDQELSAEGSACGAHFDFLNRAGPRCQRFLASSEARELGSVSRGSQKSLSQRPARLRL